MFYKRLLEKILTMQSMGRLKSKDDKIIINWRTILEKEKTLVMSSNN